jgi:mRNA-degrading endonuclease YafQ of YafQ-DinJ toxin-antitoxin module
VKYRFEGTQRFWEKRKALTPRQRESADRAWKIFKQNPFDPRLRSHKIHKLSSQYRRTVYAAVIEGDLRVIFCVEGDRVVSMDIGSHDVYRG